MFPSHDRSALTEKFQGQLLAAHAASSTIIRYQYRVDQEADVLTNDVICNADDTYETIINSMETAFLATLMLSFMNLFSFSY